jgi:hypothetical protein
MFEIPDAEKFKARTIVLLSLCPELFLCGFLWTGLGYGCFGCSTHSAAFYFATGFGSGVGALLGHFLSHFEMVDGFPTVTKQEVFHGCAYFCAIFLGSGTTWQRIVNDTIGYGMNFTEAFFFVWLMCFLLFLTVLTAMRFLNTRYARAELNRVLDVNDDFMSVKDRFIYDIQLSATIAFADAFFVGTVTEYRGTNWLSPAFGVYPSTCEFPAMLLSGASTLTGFVLMQMVQNMFLKKCWLDPVETKKAQNSVASMSSSGDVALKSLTESPMQQNASMA